MKTYNIAKLKAQLSKAISEVLRGEDVIITDHNKPICKFVSVSGYVSPPVSFNLKQFLASPPAVLKPNAMSNLDLLRRIRDND